MPITWCTRYEVTIKGEGASKCFIPSHDGSDYDDYETQPAFSDIGRGMVEYTTEKGEQRAFIIVAVGKLGSERGNVTGISSKPITYRHWLNLNAERRQGKSYQETVKDLFDARTPFRHVSAFIVKGSSA